MSVGWLVADREETLIWVGAEQETGIEEDEQDEEIDCNDYFEPKHSNLIINCIQTLL